ncbi:MAG TPA: serine/threonine-protein kinase [Gemmataceae bacterium]|nr:serine/threonine-protein kinase [Gemmataceae bacterium]
MSASPPDAVRPPASEQADDARLASILDEMTARLRAGQPPDIDAVANAHTDLAADLRELWGAVQLAENLARRSEKPTLPQALPPSASGPLPRTFGDYELLEEIGRGGMGVVYKARQRSLDRVVAVKMILRGALASPAELARFRAEATAAAHLEHPHIVPVHEVGDCDGEAYFSMRYVEGKTLSALTAAGPLPPRRAAEYLLAITEAVAHAHRHGVLHRDLKPSNIIVDHAGQPHVTDFGLAKRFDAAGSVTSTGNILGTPSYMAPEQAAGSRGTLSPATDIYSLGAILYEMLTGRPPFQAASPMDTLMLVLEQEPVAPRLLNPNVDRDLETICLRCLQKPADLRYASADELAHDLRAFLNGEPLASRPHGLAYFCNRMLRETHHAALLENWGLLWMWHSLVLFVLCCLTNCLYLAGIRTPGPYAGLWCLGLGTWATIFWLLRLRGGPVSFVERQIVHVWAGSTLGSMSLFLIEWLLGLPVLQLSPVLGILAGMVFLVKAGVLSGTFYLAAAACFVTAVVMALWPAYGLFVFGAVSALGFFLPGLKYYRQRIRRE